MFHLEPISILIPALPGLITAGILLRVLQKAQQKKEEEEKQLKKIPIRSKRSQNN